MSEQAYKELPPVPEGTGWAEVLEAAEKKLDAARATIAELEKRIGEERMCVGCGSTQTIEDIRKDHPAALACCPERKMLTLKEWRQRSDKFEQALTAERQRRKAQSD